MAYAYPGFAGKLLTGQTRLPGFHGKWEVKRLGELCSMKSGEGITAKNIDDIKKRIDEAFWHNRGWFDY